MGKAEAGTLKSFSNNQKSKGLQKLRWYCEMCQKQCRDENGFKCHTRSESHLKNMISFGENASKLVASYSLHFENSFMAILKRKGGKQNANTIYQEYISDKNHIHMSATRWKALTTFLNHLHCDGKAIVEISEKGMFAEYINRNSDQLKELEKKKENEKLTEEETQQRILDTQMAIALKNNTDAPITNATDLIRTDDSKVSFSLKVIQPKISELPILKNLLNNDNNDDNSLLAKRKRSNLDALIEEQEHKLQSTNNNFLTNSNNYLTNEGIKKENWITKGLVVKIMNKTLENGNFYKVKGEIINVKDLFLATVETDNGTIKLDQNELETVIPNINKTVRIVNGRFLGEDAILQEINSDNFCCTLKLLSGKFKDCIVNKVDYEDVCKI